MTNNLINKLFLVVTLVALSACVSIPKPQPDLTNPVRTVVILPFSNMSNNIDAPTHVRKTLSAQLKAKFYRVVSLDQIDQTLIDKLGITLGEQLAEVSFKDVAAALPADGYILGHITHYDQTMTGILNTNRVRTELKMVQADESIFWSSSIGIKSESQSDGLAGSFASLASAASDANDDTTQWITIQRKTGGDGSVLGNLISGIVEKAVASMTETTLTEETVAMVNHATMTLRNGPGI